LDILNI